MGEHSKPCIICTVQFRYTLYHSAHARSAQELTTSPGARTNITIAANRGYNFIQPVVLYIHQTTAARRRDVAGRLDRGAESFCSIPFHPGGRTSRLSCPDQTEHTPTTGSPVPPRSARLERRVGVLEQHLEVGLVPLAGLGRGLERLRLAAEAVVARRRRVARAVALTTGLLLFAASAPRPHCNTPAPCAQLTLTQTKASARSRPVLAVGRTPLKERNKQCQRCVPFPIQAAFSGGFRFRVGPGDVNSG